MIQLIRNKVREKIADEIKLTRAYLAFADSAPVKSFIDQISLIILYVNKNFDIHGWLNILHEIKGKTNTALLEKVILMVTYLKKRTNKGCSFFNYTTRPSLCLVNIMVHKLTLFHISRVWVTSQTSLSSMRRKHLSW